MTTFHLRKELLSLKINESTQSGLGEISFYQDLITNWAQSGLDGMMDIARQAFKEAQDDSYEHVKNLGSEFRS
jgi:hypothetical protein